MDNDQIEDLHTLLAEESDIGEIKQMPTGHVIIHAKDDFSIDRRIELQNKYPQLYQGSYGPHLAQKENDFITRIYRKWEVSDGN